MRFAEDLNLFAIKMSLFGMSKRSRVHRFRIKNTEKYSTWKYLVKIEDILYIINFERVLVY